MLLILCCWYIFASFVPVNNFYLFVAKFAVLCLPFV